MKPGTTLNQVVEMVTLLIYRIDSQTEVDTQMLVMNINDT